LHGALEETRRWLAGTPPVYRLPLSTTRISETKMVSFLQILKEFSFSSTIQHCLLNLSFGKNGLQICIPDTLSGRFSKKIMVAHFMAICFLRLGLIFESSVSIMKTPYSNSPNFTTFLYLHQ